MAGQAACGAFQTCAMPYPHKTFDWNDVTVTVESDSRFVRQLAGDVENGRAIMTDPAIRA
ncbi:MAG: hypothetical protein ABLQ96_09455 [Candidatus Acidiferrum sp.]